MVYQSETTLEGTDASQSSLCSSVYAGELLGTSTPGAVDVNEVGTLSGVFHFYS